MLGYLFVAPSILAACGKVRRRQTNKIVASFEEEKRERKLAQLLRKEEEDTVKLLAEKYRIPYVDLATVPVNIDALALVRENDARAGELAVIQKVGKKLEIAVRNPETPKTREVLDGLARERYTWDLFLVSKASLEKAWALYPRIARRGRIISGEVEVSSSRLHELRSRAKTLPDIARLLAGTQTKPTTDILEMILAGALETDASDVHLEPQAESVRLRYRLDGVLNDVATLPTASYKFILSRIKLISEMKLNVQTRGQDGRFTIKAEGTDIEVRTSTLPGPYGENIVLRILNPTAIAIGFGALGMQPWIQEAVAQELAKPNGMILTTGPTGSGKTTTLYAFLRVVHKPGIKIITLEDPIEYHLPGVEQTQVEPEKGYDFAGGLRSIMRQDPDMILVGEIRDLETAQTAMHAALTGHLVFTTLHTNNAAGTIPRLLDLGVDPAIMAPAINVAMAQRLVRRLCSQCQKITKPSKKEAEAVQKELAALPPSVPKPKLKTPLMLPRASGCAECNGTGYKGRTGVFEIILVDDVIEKMVFQRPSEVDLKKAMREQGQITMRQDGILKVLAGITDLAEVERVVGAG
ncbi:MAG: Flp pilus assembly complex ATPase component TadA [Candidatus Sungbacteria bacterium]|uniref:Flp pilus assembly complex ATPase component TadA n=1 Tax=Candidatus Sungiibacteriota bacterium TaxID=2750080 RepID=A0A932YWA2_9BACT|nr:Flp pilus assembly complex ATPase component TadA [Candidatus Sungbacteria bacterium]